MARPLRLEFPGALYHVTTRGNAQLAIFLDDDDRTLFLDELARVIQRFHWICHGYCLMGNHYHLIIETPEANLSRGMRQLNGVYTQRHNFRHSRVGHVFQGRYKAILVEHDSYLLELARYVVLNPVRASMCATAADYLWSSYHATAGLIEPPAWLTVASVLGHFSPQQPQAQLAYQKFVNAAQPGQPWKQIKGQVFLGSEAFVTRMQDYARQPGHEENLEETEIPRHQRHAGRPALDNLIPPQLADKTARNQAIRTACREHGYSHSETARHTGLHYTTISRIVNED